MSKFAMNTVAEMEKDYREEISNICEGAGPLWKGDTMHHDFDDYSNPRTLKLVSHVVGSVIESRWTNDPELCRFAVLFYDGERTYEEVIAECLDLEELMHSLACVCMENMCENYINGSQSALSGFIMSQGEYGDE